MIIADITVVPVGTGSASLSAYVAEIQKRLKQAGFEPILHAMGTIVEDARMERVLEAVKVAHEAAFEAGAVRVVTAVKIDERRDKNGSVQQKLRSVQEKLQ